VSSGGVFPNSVTQDGDLVYVLNSAGAGNITGFRLSQQGKLTPIPNSTRVINGNQDPVRPDTLFNPTQVSFTPDGRHLVVTIKDGPVAGLLPEFLPQFLPQTDPPTFINPTGPGRVLVFGIGNDGRPTNLFARNDLDNLGPFGFSFDSQGRLLIALFLGGPPVPPSGSPTGAVASFQIQEDGSLNGITVAALDFQLDTCWFENDGRYGYSANYTSGTVSSFGIGADGALRLLDRKAGTTEELPGGTVPGQNRQGSTPLDIRVVDQFVYDVLPGSGKVAAWKINDDGSLAPLGEFPIPIDADNVTRLKTINGDVAMCEVSPGVLKPCEFGPGASPAGIAGY
jgi:hypothetical protein